MRSGMQRNWQPCSSRPPRTTTVDVPAPDTVDVKIPVPTVLAQGSCGDDVRYTVTDDGVMTFSGTGQLGADAPFDMTGINNGMDASVFAQDEALMALRDSITEIVIEEVITSTANCAFMRMQGLRKITFPQSCTVLGNAVLYGCPALTDVTLSDGTVILPEFCFKACTALETIVIPEKTEVINTEAFNGCRALHTVHFAGDVLRDIWVGAFCETSSLTQIDLPDSLQVIEGNAFQYSGLRSIDLTGTDARIAGKAFGWCDQLETILLPDSMTELETDALSYLSALKTVKLGKSLRTIKNSAFRQSSLGDLVLPASLIEISGKAFTNMSSLQQITVEADNPYFCSVDGVLYNRDMTRLIAYPSGRSDTSFYVPETVTEIGAYAFYTPRLEVILFAGEIRHMAKYAIYLPKSLQQVIFSGDVPALWERCAIYPAQSKAQWCVIYYPGDADGWTEGKWTAPDGTEYPSAVRD